MMHTVTDVTRVVSSEPLAKSSNKAKSARFSCVSFIGSAISKLCSIAKKISLLCISCFTHLFKNKTSSKVSSSLNNHSVKNFHSSSIPGSKQSNLEEGKTDSLFQENLLKVSQQDLQNLSVSPKSPNISNQPHEVHVEKNVHQFESQSKKEEVQQETLKENNLASEPLDTTIDVLKKQAAIHNAKLFESVKDSAEKLETLESKKIFWDLFLKNKVIESRDDMPKAIECHKGEFCIWLSKRYPGYLAVAFSFGEKKNQYDSYIVEDIVPKILAFLKDPTNSIHQFNSFISSSELINQAGSALNCLWAKDKLVYSKQEVEKALKDAPDYDFRIWQSSTKKDVISYAIKLPSGLIDIRRIADPSKGIVPNIMSGALIATYDQHLLDLKQKQVSQQKSQQKYDQQIILDLGSGNTAKGLIGKAKKQELPSDRINLTEYAASSSLEDTVKFPKTITKKSRIYIVGHCDEGCNYISSDENVTITAKDFAKMIAHNAPDLVNATSKEVLTISVIACFGGSEKLASSKSFSAELYKELTNLHIPCKVLGRTDVVSRWDGRENGYFKKVGGKYQITGNKLVFDSESPNGRSLLYPNTDLKNIKIQAGNLKFLGDNTLIQNSCLNIKFMSKDDVEDYLKKVNKQSFVSNWLIRQDEKTGNMTLSILNNNTNKVDHYPDLLKKNSKIEDLFTQSVYAKIWKKYYPKKSSHIKDLMSRNALFFEAEKLDVTTFRQDKYTVS